MDLARSTVPWMRTSSPYIISSWWPAAISSKTMPTSNQFLLKQDRRKNGWVLTLALPTPLAKLYPCRRPNGVPSR